MIQRFVKKQRRGGEACARGEPEWGGGVAALLLDREGEAECALLANADNGDRTCDAREDVFDHGTTLVDHQEGADASRLEQLHDRPCSAAFRLLVVPETQIDVGLGPMPGEDLCLDALQDAGERALVVEGAPPPDQLLIAHSDDLGGERRMCPAFIRRRVELGQ